MSSPAMTLYYFPVPGAPGELVRAVLAVGGFDWKVCGLPTRAPARVLGLQANSAVALHFAGSARLRCGRK